MPARKQPTNLKLSPEVGIRSLKDLTKDELIYCINNACTDEYRLNWALISVADLLRCGSLLRLHAARSS